MLNENVANKTNEIAELDLVFISDKEVMTDSLIVADVFGKDHSKVLRDIRDLIREIEGFGGQAKFGQSFYVNQQGREMPKYTMDKDAFLMLVMGYRGTKATEIRYRYIQSFNAMYEYIQNVAKTRQETLFNAIRENDISEAESSLAGKVLNKRKHDKPRLLNAIKRAARDMQSDMFLEWNV